MSGLSKLSRYSRSTPQNDLQVGAFKCHETEKIDVEKSCWSTYATNNIYIYIVYCALYAYIYFSLFLIQYFHTCTYSWRKPESLNQLLHFHYFAISSESSGAWSCVQTKQHQRKHCFFRFVMGWDPCRNVKRNPACIVLVRIIVSLFNKPTKPRCVCLTPHLIIFVF